MVRRACLECGTSWVHRGVVVSVLVSSVVEREFIGGVMVSVLVSSVLDHGFIGGVMVRRACLECGRSWVHRWGNG